MAQASSPLTVQIREKDGTKKNVACPPLLPDYQSFMRRIERGDQLMGYYNVGRRSKKWWKPFFSFLLEVSVLNAYILQKSSKTGGKEQNYLNFHLGLAVELVEKRSQGGQPQTFEHRQLLRLDNFQSHFPECVTFKRNCIVYSRT